jgi:hypothetical protein
LRLLRCNGVRSKDVLLGHRYKFCALGHLLLLLLLLVKLLLVLLLLQYSLLLLETLERWKIFRNRRS